MDHRIKKLLWIGCLGIGVLAALVLFWFDPARSAFYPLCTFHRLTGLDCPGCGSLRALHALLHGRVVEALQFNALTVLSLPLLAWLGFRFAWNKYKAGPPVKVRPLWLWLYLTAWIAFGILRELPVPFLAWFAP